MSDDLYTPGEHKAARTIADDIALGMSKLFRVQVTVRPLDGCPLMYEVQLYRRDRLLVTLTVSPEANWLRDLESGTNGSVDSAEGH